MTSTILKASTISLALQLGGGQDIGAQLMGNMEIDHSCIRNYDDYELIYKKRHDLIHAVVCDKLQIPFGERTVDSVLQDRKYDAQHQENYEEVKKQTPDYMDIKDGKVTIIEITVSHDPKAKFHKQAKYTLLCKVLSDAGFTINYKIYVFNPLNIYQNRTSLIADGLDDVTIDFAKTICDNSRKLLRLVHATKDGQLYYERFYEISDVYDKISFEAKDTMKTHLDSKNKCFHQNEDLEDILYKPVSKLWDDSDERFIQHCYSRLDSITSDFEIKEKFDEEAFLDEHRKCSKNKDLRSVMPMSFISPKIIDASYRSTEDDISKVLSIAAMMVDCSSSYMSSIGSDCIAHFNSILKVKKEVTNEDFLFKVRLSEQDKRDMAIEGPNRKKYVRQGSKPHKDATDEHSGYWLSPDVDVDEVEKISFLFSDKNKIKESGDVFTDSKCISTLSGFGLDYAKFCQTIYREININSMRGDRRHKYIIKPTGAEGVFIMLHPGTKLRCGEQANVVWFKILIKNSSESHDIPHHNSWLFKKLHRDVSISYTNWLTADVHRLDHYIRCYDKILMSYLAVISQRNRTDINVQTLKEDKEEKTIESESKTLVELINSDQSNVLGLIIITYLEDRRSTSKMLQNVRYLVMNSLSIFPKYKSVMKKFVEPIRSPLQLYYIKKCLAFIRSMHIWSPTNNAFFGSVKYDNKSHTFIDMMGGSLIRLPRPLVTSPNTYADFSEILSEMYFTMLFNKNQDDPTHASFQILDKILEGEESYKEIKSSNLHLGYLPDASDEEFADILLKKKHTHMFSRKAITSGSKLLRMSLNDDHGDQIKQAVRKRNLNKTLDEYATFKSSSEFKSDTFIASKGKQNPRRKCIEGVMELLKEGLTDSYSVAVKYKEEKTFYQVFKKNQIGGVREILILPITNRIRINILETLSRNICIFDRREILTHGMTKNESLKAVLYAAKKLDGNRAPIHMTFDKSKWGPSFVPIQFMYLFSPFKQELGPLFPYLVDILIRHQNKFCILPERLISTWHKDEAEEHTHSYPALQSLKENFHRTGGIIMENESNMGQGILHYTSSLLHLCMVSFRNKLYEMWCKDRMMDPNDHDDILSSDDSYTIFCPELYGKNGSAFIKSKLLGFLRCQQMAEFLFNCRTSMVKSSINPFIGEFNSLFISNMSFIPTLFKFCLSSVHPPNTDSFYRMVKECYGASRQILENGGTLDLYLTASFLNKEYCESIYHTHPGGHNDLLKLGITKSPYHLGTYPIFNPTLMVMFGPDYYNYKLFIQHWPEMSDDEKKLFSASHKLIKGGLVETMAEFEDGDTILGGLIRIEAQMGPIKSLERLRRSAIMTKEDLEQHVELDPIAIIKKPKTLKDIIFRTTHKLYTTGSKEAVKNLAASIFYGRMSATVSAKCFYIPNGTVDKRTYFDCVKHLLDTESMILNLDPQMKFLYPKSVDYDFFIKNDVINLTFSTRNPFEIQTIQTLTTHKVFTKLTQSVPELLDYKWLSKPVPEHLASKVDRDFSVIKKFYPMVKETLQDTLNQFSGETRDKIKAVLLLILRLYSLRDRSFKGVIFGSGSNDITRTYEVILENNYCFASTARSTIIPSYIRSELSFEKIYCAYNHYILSELAKNPPKERLWKEVNEEELTLLFQDPSISRQIKKRLLMIAMLEQTITQVEDWSRKSGFVMHYWLVKQKYNDNLKNYYGDFDLVIFLGEKKLRVRYNNSNDLYHFSKSPFDNPDTLYLLFSEVSGLLSTNISEMVSKTQRGHWAIEGEKVIRPKGSDPLGFFIGEDTFIENPLMDDMKISVDDDWIRLTDDQGRRLFNVETGLLSCTYSIPIEYDFDIFGLKFSSLCSLDAFNQNFSVMRKSRKETIKHLEDVVVEKPKISDVTKNRLKLQDWETKKDEPTDDGFTLEDTTDYIASLMDIDVTTFMNVDDLLTQQHDEIDVMLEFLSKTDVIFSMKTSQRIQHSRRIFMIVKNLKYDLICRHILLDMKINRNVIIKAPKLVHEKYKEFILYAIVSYYDRTVLNTEVRTPEGFFIDLDQRFINRFGDEDDYKSDTISPKSPGSDH